MLSLWAGRRDSLPCWKVKKEGIRCVSDICIGGVKYFTCCLGWWMTGSVVEWWCALLLVTMGNFDRESINRVCGWSEAVLAPDMLE